METKGQVYGTFHAKLEVDLIGVRLTIRLFIFPIKNMYFRAVFFNLFWFTAPCKTEKNLVAPLPG